MTQRKQSRNALDGKIVILRRGLAIYRVKASPFWRVRIWVPSKKKRVVKTTKATTRVEAISIAEDFLSAMGTRGLLIATAKDLTFEHFADRLVQIEKVRGEAGEISSRASNNTKNLLNNPTWGAIKFFDLRTFAQSRPRTTSSISIRFDNLTHS